MRRVVAVVVAGVTIVHGLIHLLGAAKGLGWAEVPELTAPISSTMGLVWLGAAVVVVLAGGMLLVRARGWWVVAGLAALVSQTVIITSWTDAKAGTAANLLLAVAATWGVFADGPASLRAEYRRAVAVAEAGVATGCDAQPGVVTEDDLRLLPPPVAAFVRASGAVGRPRVVGFTASFRGRIRSGPTAPWMPFTGTQVNTYGSTPARVFFLDATMRGLPADVLHTYVGPEARMQVRAGSLIRVVDVRGPEMTRSETVTLLNDLVVFAPAAIVDAPITWTPVDDHQAEATYTNAGHTVRAVLVFDEAHRLVDFVSDDRSAVSADGRTFTPTRWSTPISAHRDVDGREAGAVGIGRWHPVDGPAFDYLEITIDDLTHLEVP